MNERKLTKSELAKREDIIMKMKDNKRALVQKYGKDAEAVMYGRATNLAKTKAEAMDQDKLREMIKDALQNPKKADLNKDGKLSDYEEKRGAAIEKSMVDEIDLDLKGGTQSNTDDAEAGILGAEDVLGLEEGSSSEEKRIAMSAIKRLAKYRGVSQDEAKADLLRAVKELGDLKEDLDLGHEDNEPGMLKAELYHIGSYAMDLYKMMDALEGQGEVDFPAWWQSKITTAKNMISGAKHYLEFELKEPTIDAMVDRMDDIAPEMEVDVVDDIEEVDGFNPKKTDDPQLDRFRAKGQLEGNLDPKETASLEQEGRFWVVTYRTMDGKESKPFQSEDEARKFYNTLDEGLPKGYWDKKMDAKDEVDESYNTLVNKIKKQGQSEKSAKAIAGAVASYKAKGGGKGPTAKQKG